MVIILNLNGVKAFNNVSHARFLYNFLKKKVPEYIICWVKDFLSDKFFFLILNNEITLQRKVNAGIPQESPILFILYLFFNANLVEKYSEISIKTILIGFVDDVNILIYEKITKKNCRILNRIYTACA